MTQEKIQDINTRCPDDQGIFKEPFGLESIKEPVVYMRWLRGRWSGGGYWDGAELEHEEGDPEPSFVVLDMVLKELYPSIGYVHYKEIEAMLNEDDGEDNRDYYGNCEEYYFKWIVLSDLENWISKNKI